MAGGMLSPLLKAPAELAFGENLFTGRPMTRQQSALLGRTIEGLDPSGPVKRWLGYQKTFDKAGRPAYTFDGERFYMLFQSWALSRLISTTDRQFKTYAEDPAIAPILWDTLTGLRLKKLDLNEEGERKKRERMEQLRQALLRAGGRKEYRTTFIPQ